MVETHGEMRDRIIKKVFGISDDNYTLHELEERIDDLLAIEQRAAQSCRGTLPSDVCVKCGWSHKPWNPL
jgi:hypothetical protein